MSYSGYLRDVWDIEKWFESNMLDLIDEKSKLAIYLESIFSICRIKSNRNVIHFIHDLYSFA